MQRNLERRAHRTVAVLLCVVMPVAASMSLADDYVHDKVPSVAAKVRFAAVPDGLPAKKISVEYPQRREDGDAFYTDDGAISIPPGAMVEFSLSGKCMDPHLPAPAAGEPMQFVDVGKLVPYQLRAMYENLMARQAKGDPVVLTNNPQHLVWAIRTAGTDDAMANSLSDAQLALLDDCAGRRGTFIKYHEKTKRRNARKNKKGGDGGSGRVSVGSLSYDASELSRANGARRIESHIAELTEMGEKSTVRTAADFRYGEIEDELYSDVVGNGGLSFRARILNASEHRREFRLYDFAAQVGNGSEDGGKRQRVTMGPPSEIIVVTGAVQEGVEIDRSITEMEIEGQSDSGFRNRTYRQRRVRGGEGHVESETSTARNSRTRRNRQITVTDIPPVEPVEPVPPMEPAEPIVIVRTNTVTRTRTVPEKLAVRVVSLEYDPEKGSGTLVVEITRGTFREAARHIREHLGDLVREGARTLADGPKIPPALQFEVESIAISEDDLCEVGFKAMEAR